MREKYGIRLIKVQGTGVTYRGFYLKTCYYLQKIDTEEILMDAGEVTLDVLASYLFGLSSIVASDEYKLEREGNLYWL